MALEVLHMDSAFALGAYDRVILQSWTAKVKKEDVVVGYEHGHKIAQRFAPEKIAAIAIADTKSGLPDEETRKLSAEMIQKMKDAHAASAIVLEGSGFWSSAARAAVTGIHLLARTPFPTKPFATVELASEWVGSYFQWPPDRIAALATAMHELRAKQKTA
ncbi:MAG: hypothetical protein IT381_12475 [Deltaproteobacteria bacterium]|nr:hypothetical protein [Deltaproteobacteria bacterium]